MAWVEANRAANGFADSLARQLATAGRLSDRQVEAVGRCVKQDAARQQREAERAARLATAVPAPEGTTTVEGVIVSTRVEPSSFSYYGSVFKMLVEADGGWQVWSTQPASLRDATAGARVRFVADLQRAEGDELFVYAKRPREAEVLVGAAAGA